MGTIWQDLRQGGRHLLQQPSFAFVAIFSIALGVGLNTAIFSFLSSLLLHPFPLVREPDRLVAIYSQDKGSPTLLPVSFPNFRDLRQENRSFSSLAAFQVIQVGLVTKDEAQQVYGEMVTANFFAVLGIEPELGRTFLPEEDRTPGANPVAVLSHDVWMERLGGRPDVVGKTIRLNGHPFTVIGVAPRGFRGTNAILASAVWVPISMYKQVFSFSAMFDQRGGRVLRLIGRLRPGSDLPAAQSEMKTLAALLAAQYPEDNRDQTLSLLRFNQAAIPPDRREIFVKTGALLMMIVTALLLLACVNVANLVLTRTLGRRKELAIRLSLGATRGRLLRQLVTESLLISLCASALGLLIADWTCRLLWLYRPPYFISDTPAFALDFRVLGFTITASVVATLLFAVLPSAQVCKPELMLEMKESTAAHGEGSQHFPLRRLSVAVQVALSLVCLACSQFFLFSLSSAQRIDPGFDASHLLTVSFDLRSQGYDPPRARAFEDRLLERVRSLSGVESAALADNRVLGGWSWWMKITRPGQEIKASEGSLLAGSTIVGPEYFRTVGIPLLQGRTFTEQDREGSRPVAIINRTLAKRISPSASIVGSLLQLDEEAAPVEVVGVVQDSKYRTLGEEPQPFVYVPLLQRGTLKATLHVRSTSTRPEAVATIVASELRTLDRMLPLGDVRTGSEIVSRSLWAPRAGAVVLSIFGGVALILAAVGVYGVTAYSVAQRRFEIGLRIALGAQRSNLLGMLLRQGMTIVVLGLAVGLLAADWLNRWLATLLYSGRREGWLSLLWVAILLGAVALVANYVPAARAARANPVRTLRGA